MQSRALRGMNPSTSIAPAGVLRLYRTGRGVYSRRPSSRLATGLSVVVIGSVLYYVGKKRGERKHAQSVSSGGGSATTQEIAGKSVPTTGAAGSATQGIADKSVPIIGAASLGTADKSVLATGAAGSATQGTASKSVLITGAAGDIGGATATAFAIKGATVILVDLPSTQDLLEKKCEELMAKGAKKAVFKTADVTRVEDVQQMTEFAVANAGRIDCFFNNAGVQGEFQPLHKQTIESFQKVMNVNIYGAFLGMKYVSQAMIESGGGGVIVNTASLAGMLGPPNMAAYTASKHAVVGMTKTAAKDLAPHSIRVCAISPGIVEGKMWYSQIKGQVECRKRLAGDNTDVTAEELKEREQRMIDDTPMKRLGQLSEVASVVVFLCSDKASYLTGTVVPIDGGKLQ